VRSATKQFRIPVISLIMLLFFSVSAAGNWKLLSPGLELGSFPPPQQSGKSDAIIRVLRIDPQRYGLRLLNASAIKEGHGLSAKEWSLKFGMQAAINASMYQKDYKTSVSLMRRKGHVNNARLSKDKAILAFDSNNSQVPLVTIIDRQCDDFHKTKNQYRTLIQNIRMISCRGINVWRQQSGRWSTAALALDSNGKVLFIHVKSPYSTHDLADILLGLPLGIDRAMYLEGGPQAQLFVQSGGKTYEFFGSYSGTFSSTAPSNYAWPIPNVIGVYQKPGLAVHK
jgi:hypothetical protein